MRPYGSGSSDSIVRIVTAAPPAWCCATNSREQAGRDERRGRVEHEHGAAEALKRLLRGRDGVAGPARVFLHGD